MKIAESSISLHTSKPRELSELLVPVRDDLNTVEEWLRTNLVDNSQFISDLLSQVFKAGGKRIRPALVFLSARASAQPHQVNRLHVILAVLTELIHTASLIHDDVIDRSSLRRGVETVNRRWNERVAVLMGDLLFAQASICLSRLMNPVIVGIYGKVLGDLCAGEIRQMNQHYNCVVDWDGYIQKSIWKTASLFAAGCHSAPILSGQNDLTIESMKVYGLNLGICFQIMDDLLDVTGSANELGKAAGSDLSQGVITAPALFVLERKDGPAIHLERLIKSRAVNQPEGLAEALKIVVDNGGVEATQKLCSRYADLSRKALGSIPPSMFKDSLMDTVAYMLARTA